MGCGSEMVKGIENLPVLNPDDWHKVRDITIPIRQIDAGGGSRVVESDIHGATCFTGSPNAKRLYDPESPNSFARLIDIISKVDPNLQLGLKRFRLDQDGLSFRVQLGTNVDTQDLQMRVLPQETPSLTDLNLPESWRAMMTDHTLLNGGLILITAPNGQGKTTTASAIVRSRLEQYGGLANTCEDPVELPLQGVWGQGICYQRPANTEYDLDNPGEGYYRALIDALRQFPAITGGGTMLFVGEIRDGKTAKIGASSEV